MKKQRRKKNISLDVEFLGSIVGIILIFLGVTTFIDYQNSSIFLGAVMGLGALLNAILAYLKFRNKNYFVGTILLVVALSLLVLLGMNLLLGQGV